MCGPFAGSNYTLNVVHNTWDNMNTSILNCFHMVLVMFELGQIWVDIVQCVTVHWMGLPDINSRNHIWQWPFNTLLCVLTIGFIRYLWCLLQSIFASSTLQGAHGIISYPYMYGTPCDVSFHINWIQLLPVMFDLSQIWVDHVYVFIFWYLVRVIKMSLVRTGELWMPIVSTLDKIGSVKAAPYCCTAWFLTYQFHSVFVYGIIAGGNYF